jgi:arginase
MSIIIVPYHLDEHTPDLDIPLPPGTSVTTTIVADLAEADLAEEDLPEASVWSRLGHLYEAVAAAVATSVRTGGMSTVVSGDCMVALGTVAGVQRAGVSPSIVWFDAHGDVQTLETTVSGYLGGMPLRILLGYRPELISQQLGLTALTTRQAVLVDGRDLDPPEVEFLAESGLRRHGVDELTADLLPDGPLVLHLDLDVVDADELTGLRFPASAGPTATSVLAAAARVLATGRVVAMDVCCTWHPGVDDPTGRRAHILATLVQAADGR